jgi:hypothetical protein
VRCSSYPLSNTKGKDRILLCDGLVDFVHRC